MKYILTQTICSKEYLNFQLQQQNKNRNSSIFKNLNTDFHLRHKTDENPEAFKVNLIRQHPTTLHTPDQNLTQTCHNVRNNFIVALHFSILHKWWKSLTIFMCFLQLMQSFRS